MVRNKQFGVVALASRVAVAGLLWLAVIAGTSVTAAAQPARELSPVTDAMLQRPRPR